MTPAPYGAQNERTALAWQRTALSLMAASAVLSRLTFAHLGPAGLVSGAVAIPLTLWVFLESRGRYQDAAEIRTRGRPRSGRAATALTCALVAMAVTELVSVLSG